MLFQFVSGCLENEILIMCLKCSIVCY
uniref:Uncharacterized protein n=1 Tax=Arundo donax TaxID=35708 RepID=A0A0A8Y7C6_ARUDO